VVVVLIIAQHFASASCCFVVSCLLFVVVWVWEEGFRE
jgi:hypothetical protein